MLASNSPLSSLRKRLWTIAIGLLRHFGWGILAAVILLFSGYLIRCILLVSSEEISQESVLVFAIAMKDNDIADHEPRLRIKKENDTFEAVTKTAASPRPLLQGSPDEIAGDLRQYQALGVHNFNINLPGFDISQQAEAMDQFAHEVVPLLS